MLKFRIVRVIGDLNRLRQILTAFAEGGFAVLIKKLKLTHCLSVSCRIKCFLNRFPSCQPEELPEKLRLILEQLGPTFIKIGQILSVRPDFIPVEYAKELTKLQDRVPFFPYEEAKEIIELELQQPIKEVFKSFDETPLAAASLAQVHKAVLKNGQEVAIKIQRPNIKDIIEKDLRIIAFLASLLEKYVPESRNFRPVAAAQEFANYTLKELGFIIEGKNADRFRHNFKDEKGIKIPKIYWEYCTSKILVMEFIEGVKMGDLNGMKKLNIDHAVLAQNCAKACVEPILMHGFFHADPHPGNVWVIKNNVVCYLDFGMVGVVTKDMKKYMLLFFKSLLDKEVEASLKHLLKLTEAGNEGADYDAFKREASELMISLYIDSTRKETMAKTFYRIISSAAKHGLVFPSNMILLAKSLMTGETMCLLTHPDFDLIESSKPAIEKIYQEEFGPKKVVKSLEETLPVFIEFMEKLPEISSNLIKKLEKGELDISLTLKPERNKTWKQLLKNI